jgi:hypothetical protein
MDAAMQFQLSSRPVLSARHHWLILVLGAVFLALSIQYTVKAMANRSAILRWRDQLQHLEDENIYARYAYPNPPIMAILLEPISQLPPLAGSLLWFYLKASLAVLAIYYTFRLVETSARPFPAWAKGLTIVLSIRPIFGDLTHGNVNIFILFLVVGALYAFRCRQDMVCGLMLALAIACKVTPALFLPYFVWKRAWKVLAGCGLGLLLFLLLIPGWYLGKERNLTLLHSWVDQMVTPYVVNGKVTTEHQNQSLPGLLYRLLTYNPSFLDEMGSPQRYDNLANLDPTVVAWMVKGAMLAFACLMVCSCRTPFDQRNGWRLPAEFSLVVLGMLLFSERTWKHHCVTLLLPFAVVSYCLAAGPAKRGVRLCLAGSLLLVFLLMSSTSTTLFEFVDAKMAQVYGAYVWAYLILMVTIAYLLFFGERDAAEAVGTPNAS